MWGHSQALPGWAWFSCGPLFQGCRYTCIGYSPRIYRLPLSHGVLVRFLRFRLGCHHLRVNTGRWVQPPLPRRQRVCLRCHSACLDDETHCLLVCSHLTMVDAREKMHAAIPVAFRHNIATYAQFWGVLGRLLSPDMVYATVKFVAVCTILGWHGFLTSPEVPMHISYQRFWLIQIHIWICLIQNQRMHQTLKSL